MTNTSTISAVKVRDQGGNIVFKVTSENKIGYVYEGDLSTAKPPTQCLAEILGRQGLHLISNARRAAAMAAIEHANDSPEQIKIATRPGWLDARTYVSGQGVGITAGVDDPSVFPSFSPIAQYFPGGSHRRWLERLEAPLAGQLLLQTVASFAIASMFLKPFGLVASVSGNIGLELTGPTSSGKTTALRLAASLWGKPESGADGFLKSWHTTENGFEPLLQDHCDAVLPLDEANLAGLTPHKRSEMQAHAVFLLDKGAEKTRMGHIPKLPSRVVFISSSNESLSSSLGLRHADVSSALRVRMPAIDLTRREFGILDHPGHQGAANSVEAINQAIAENNGHASLKVVRFLTQRLDRSYPKLEASVIGLTSRFRNLARYHLLSPEAQRVCNAFSLVYTAGVAAKCCGAFPTSWNIGAAVLSTFKLATQGFKHVPDGEIIALERHLSSLETRLLVLETPQLRMESPRTVGFIKQSRYGLELLVRPKQFTSCMGEFRSTMDDLGRAGILVLDGEHRTTHRSIGEKPPERVHVFRLRPECRPGQIRLARPGL